MPISVTCACGKTMSVPDQFAGKKGKCNTCGAIMEIPHPVASVSAAGLKMQPVPENAAPGSGMRAETCPACGAPTHGAGVSCERCGAPVVGGTGNFKGKLCPQCLKLCPADALICFACNYNLKNVIVAGLGSAAPEHARKERPSVYLSAPPPGLNAGSVIGLAVVLVLLGLAVWGGIGTWNWFKESDYRSHIGGGDDWKAKGFMGDAEREYRKAQEIFPERDEPRKKLKALEDERLLEEELRRKGYHTGPAGNQLVNKMAEMERRQMSQERLMQPPPEPVPPPRLEAPRPEVAPKPVTPKRPAPLLGGRYADADFKFSLHLPKQYVISDSPGIRGRKFIGRDFSGYAPELVIEEVSNKAALADFADDYAAKQRKARKDGALESYGREKLNDGSEAVRAVIAYVDGEFEVKALIYCHFFGGRTSVLRVKAASKLFKEMLETYDASFKTFEVGLRK